MLYSSQVLNFPRSRLMRSSTAKHQTSTGAPKRRVLLLQTQAENAGAQEIMGSWVRAARVATKSLICSSSAVGLLRGAAENTLIARPAGRERRCAVADAVDASPPPPGDVKPDAVLTFQHFGNVIGGGVRALVSRAPVIAIRCRLRCR